MAFHVEMLEGTAAGEGESAGTDWHNRPIINLFYFMPCGKDMLSILI